MRRLKLTLEYEGSDFFGWQVQHRTGETPNERTVQGVVQAAFAQLPGEHSGLRAAGRTDAGVHALGMVAHLDTSTTIADTALTRALNAHLPHDVRVLASQKVAPDFEAQYDCCYRYYVYRLRNVRNDLSGQVFTQRRILSLFRELDSAAMTSAAPHFEGTRDFAALATQEIRSTERTVYLCRLEQHGRDLELHIAANGFLRGMVRAVVGTLLAIGAGRLEPEAVESVLASKDRALAGPNVAPHGLYFVKAGYTPWAEQVFHQLREARPWLQT